MEIDPAQSGGNVSASVQIQNSSAFVLSILAAGEPYTIQPFFAQTIPTGGQPIVITPTQNPQNTSGNTITIVWLLNGETPPMDDGPLNLPLSTVEQLINAGLNTAYGYLFSTEDGMVQPAELGKTLILGSVFIQPGTTSSGLVQIIVQSTTGQILGAAYPSTTPQPGVAIAYPQGVSIGPDTGVEVLFGSGGGPGPLAVAALTVVTFALAPS